MKISYFNGPIKNTTEFEDISWQDLFQALIDKPYCLPNNDSKTKEKGDYFIRGRLRGKVRNNACLPKACLTIVDVDAPEKATPKQIYKACLKIHKKHKIPFVVHSSATPGNSRAIFLCKSFTPQNAEPITRFFYDALIDCGLDFKYAGESAVFSQPWFLSQCLKTNVDKHFAGGEVNGRPFAWKGNVDLSVKKKKELPLPPTSSSISHLKKFISALKSGTIHQEVKTYVGWQARTTNLTLSQIKVDVDYLIQEHYVQTGKEDKAERWFKNEGNNLKEWFEKQDFDRANLEGDEEDEEFDGSWDIKTAEDYEMTNVKWLWENVFHARKFQIVAGDSGTNKSTFLLNVAARISMGNRPLPGSNVVLPDNAGVMLITSEDDAEDTILPRYIKAGGVRKNLVIINNDFDFNANGIAKLSEYTRKVEEEKNLKICMIILDPVDSFCGNANTNLGSVVKKICNPFNKFAMKNNVCVCGVMHFKKSNKNNEYQIKQLVAGSYAWISTPRLTLACIVNPTNPNERLIGPINSNNGPCDFHHSYSLEIGKDKTVSLKIDFEKKKDSLEKVMKKIAPNLKRIKIRAAVRKLLQYMGTENLEQMPSTEALSFLEEELEKKSWALDAKKFFPSRNVGGTWVVEQSTCKLKTKKIKIEEMGGEFKEED